MKYIADIDDASIYGITAARAAYNAQFPAEVEVTPSVSATDNAEAVPAVMGANPALLNTDEAYLDFVLQSAVQSWCEQYAPVVAPVVPVAQVAGVPQSVSFRQAKQELIVRGWWAPILAAVDAIADPVQRELMRTEVLDSQVYERQRPALLAMAKGVLHLTDTQIDQLFVESAKR